jgi:hypothetical protein
MAAADALEGVRMALLAGFEKLAGFASGNVEVGARRQAPRYCRHNLPSWNTPVVRTLRAGSQVEVVDRIAGGLSPFPRTGCFR